MSVRVRSRLPEIAAELPLRMRAASLGAAEAIAEGAKARAPVASGTLKDSIEAREKEAGAAVYAIFYWFFQEFGTTSQPAHPFMIPAAEIVRARIAEIVRPFLASL